MHFLSLIFKTTYLDYVWLTIQAKTRLECGQFIPICIYPFFCSSMYGYAFASYHPVDKQCNFNLINNSTYCSLFLDITIHLLFLVLLFCKKNNN